MAFILSKKLLQNNINKKKHESVHKATNRSLSTQNNPRIPFMQRMLNCPCGGGCPRCVEKNTAQAKLKIGAPHDKYEQEADQIAEQVMHMQENTVVSSQLSGVRRKDGHIQRMCAECEKEEEGLIQTKSIARQITPIIQRQESDEGEEEEEEFVQTKTISNNFPSVNTSVQNQIQGIKGGGQTLSSVSLLRK